MLWIVVSLLLVVAVVGIVIVAVVNLAVDAVVTIGRVTVDMDPAGNTSRHRNRNQFEYGMSMFPYIVGQFTAEFVFYIILR
jgi:hypothetical protein